MSAASDTAGPQLTGAAKVRPQQSGLGARFGRPETLVGDVCDLLLEAEDWNCNSHGTWGLAHKRWCGGQTPFRA